MKLFHSKWLCVLLAVLLMLGSVPVLADTPAPVLGDVDGSGIIDAGDALVVLQHSVRLISLDEVQGKAADVTGDGLIDAEDALYILQVSVQLRDSFPASGENNSLQPPTPEGIEIEREFPDRTFRNDVRAFDLDGNGWLSDSEISKVTYINVSAIPPITNPPGFRRDQIWSLKGIEHFTALTELHCEGNNLKSLDLTKNTELKMLVCDSNPLTELNLKENKKLEELYCRDVSLTGLNLTQNTELRYLDCTNNPLSKLDLTQNTTLNSLICCFTSLTELDLSANTQLTLVNCRQSQLTKLVLPESEVLFSVTCSNNALTELDVSQNPALKELYCKGNQLFQLDLTNNALLKTLDCDDTVIVTRWSPTLDSQTEQQMLEDFVSYLNETHSLACGVDEVGIETYFGTYNGCVVAYMRSPALYDDALTDLVVGSYTFVLPGEGPVPLIVAYKEGTFMGLREAFEAGWLTEEAVGAVWEMYVCE